MTAAKAPTLPLPPRGERTRHALLAAGHQLLADRSIDALAVDDIVQAAGVAKGTFYIHFESKERLLLSLQQRFIATFASDLRTAMSGRRPDDWAGRLRAWVEASIDVYVDGVHHTIHAV